MVELNTLVHVCTRLNTIEHEACISHVHRAFWRSRKIFSSTSSVLALRGVVLSHAWGELIPCKKTKHRKNVVILIEIDIMDMEKMKTPKYFDLTIPNTLGDANRHIWGLASPPCKII